MSVNTSQRTRGATERSKDRRRAVVDPRSTTVRSRKGRNRSSPLLPSARAGQLSARAAGLIGLGGAALAYPGMQLGTRPVQALSPGARRGGARPVQALSPAFPCHPIHLTHTPGRIWSHHRRAECNYGTKGQLAEGAAPRESYFPAWRFILYHCARNDTWREPTTNKIVGRT